MTVLVDYHAAFHSQYIHFHHCEERNDEAIQHKTKNSAVKKHSKLWIVASDALTTTVLVDLTASLALLAAIQIFSQVNLAESRVTKLRSL
jgi:hypothetical protein